MNDLDAADRLELDRLRTFVRRLAYLRSYMAVKELAMLDALTDDRYRATLAGLDRQEAVSGG